MDKEMLEQLQMIVQGMESMENRINEKIEGSESRMKVFIENTVTKRIDALFDGYKLTHEKQWELERKTESLQAKLDDLEARLAALENKTA